MKTVMFAALSFALLATICFSQGLKGGATEFMNPPSSELSYESIGSLKKAYSAFSCEWLEFDSGGHKYITCLITLPSYGSSSHTLRGWVTDPDGTTAKIFLDFRVRELGAGKLEFSRQNMRLILKGTANNKFKDVAVLQLDLR